MHNKRVLVLVILLMLFPIVISGIISSRAYAESVSGSYSITPINAFSSAFRITLSGISNATHFNVFKKSNNTVVNSVPVAIDNAINSMPAVYADITDLEVRVYSDAEGINTIAEFILTSSNQLISKIPNIPTVRVTPANQEVGQGSDVLIDINVEQVANLYATDLNLTFDPAVLRVAMIGTGQDLDGDGNEDVKPDIWINLKDQDPATEEPFSEIGVVQVDNQTGQLAISATRTGDAYADPYEGFDGDATLATIRFKAVGQGYSPLDLAAELRGNAGAADSDVYLIPANVEGGEVYVSGYSGNVIEGWVRLEGTPDGGPDQWNDGKAGIKVRQVNQATNAEQVVFTDGYGRFGFYGLPDGTYDLAVRQAGYLDVAAGDLAVAGQQHLNLEGLLLLTGDLSRNNWVELDDLKLMREAYGAWNWEERFNPAANLDWDDRIGLIDLVLLARNFALEGAGGRRVMLPKAWLEDGQVKLKAGPVAKIYYFIGSQENPPQDPDPANSGQLYQLGTGIAITEGQVIKFLAAEPSWGGVSPVITVTYDELVAGSMP